MQHQSIFIRNNTYYRCARHIYNIDNTYAAAIFCGSVKTVYNQPLFVNAVFVKQDAGFFGGPDGGGILRGDNKSLLA